MKQIVMLSLAVMAAGCLMPPKMRDTGVTAGPGSWDTIVANAQSAGYTTERNDAGARDGKYFWYVKASRDGGTIYYTKNNRTNGVAFACKGVKKCDEDGVALIAGP
jgi:hypothetical protein